MEFSEHRTFDFVDLNDETRAFMLEAIEDAERIGNIHYSTRFNDTGRQQWLWLLRHAAEEHDERWLTEQLETHHLIRELEGSRTARGGYTVKHTPSRAAQTFAEGQFNRFYMLGLCRRARVEGIPELEVYRARETPAPRPESEAMIGRRIPVDDVEMQLRDAKASLNSPLLQPNSGISLRLPR